jgi:hypothetical protein
VVLVTGFARLTIRKRRKHKRRQGRCAMINREFLPAVDDDLERRVEKAIGLSFEEFQRMPSGDVQALLGGLLRRAGLALFGQCLFPRKDLLAEGVESFLAFCQSLFNLPL